MPNSPKRLLEESHIVRLAFVLMIGVFLLGVSNPATAQDSKGSKVVQGKQLLPLAERIVNFRRREMRAISGHYRALEAVIQLGAPFKDTMAQHVSALAILADQLPKNFSDPKTVMTPGKWGAKTDIWSKPEAFKKGYSRFQQSTTELAKAIRGNDQTSLAPKLKSVRADCLSCHEQFRVRRKN